MDLWVKSRSSLTALKDDRGRSFTYGDLDKLSEELKELTRPRSLVLLYGKNSIELFSVFLALLKSDRIPLLVGGDSKNALLNIMEKYHPSYIFAKESDLKKISSIPLEEVFRNNEYALWETQEKDYEIHEDLSLLILTSGSTGASKCARVSRLNLESNCDYAIKLLDLKSSGKFICTTSISHSFCVLLVLSYLRLGALILISEKPFWNESFFDFFKKEKANAFTGVPFVFETFAELNFYERLGSGWKYEFMACFGGKFQKKFAESWEDSAKEVFWNEYGTTETGPVSAIRYTELLELRENCIGRSYGEEFAKMKIESESKELVISGPIVCMGYAENYADLKLGNENNYVFYTGDTVSVDKAGNYYIEGRIKRFVKPMGIRMDMDEMEKILKQHFNIIDLAINGDDQKIKLYYVKERNIEKGTFSNYLSKLLHIPAFYFEEKVISEMPRSSAGKILYMNLES